MELRPAFDAVFGIEDALEDVVVRSTQPALAAIKLAWWRERLQDLDDGKVPAEPRFQAVARVLLPRGITGAELAKLTEGWDGVLLDPIDYPLVSEHGVVLLSLLAALLEQPAPSRDIGLVFGCAYIARRSAAVDLDSAPPPVLDRVSYKRQPRAVRPVTILAALAGRDLRLRGRVFEPEATPGRSWTLLRHRLTGHI